MADQAEREKWEMLEKQFKEAWKKGDMEFLLKHYADNAVYACSPGQIVEGKANVKSYMTETQKKYPEFDGKKSHEAMLSEDVGIELGTFTAKEASTGQTVNGKYVNISRCVDGEWKCLYDFNSFES